MLGSRPVLKKNFLVDVLVVLGIAVNIGFLLINLAPARPHLTRRTAVKVLLRASAARIAWMKENEFSEFAKANDLDIDFISAKSFDQVAELLAKEKEKPTGILLADIEDEYAEELVAAKEVLAFEDVAKPEELAAATEEYLADAIERGVVEKKLYFLPKRSQVNIATFLKPAVEEAYLGWEKDKPGIEAALKEANGVGLPRGFTLARTPDAWSSYDLFVAAWYWAHHPARWGEVQNIASFDGAPKPTLRPRMALPSGVNDDSIIATTALFYRHGMQDAQISHPESPAVLDALQWEALFRKHGLLAPEMDDPQGLESFGINKLLKERLIAWAPIDQADALWVHGGARRDADPGMKHSRDIGWSTMPRGASLELDKNGEPLREGRSFAFEEVHLWTIPVHAPRPELAFQLARFLNQRGLQQRETEAQGMLPIRKDLARDYPILFRLVWMQQILDASYRQIQVGSGDTPDGFFDQGYGEMYAKLREQVVRRRPLDAKVDLASIRAAVLLAKPKPEVQHGQ